MNITRMLQQLELHEGFKSELYIDTEGNETIGIGYNVSARGLVQLEDLVGRKLGVRPALTLEEARKVARLDIARVEKAVTLHFPEYAKLDEVRQRVCVDLAFNIGYRALDFKKTIAAIKSRNWSQAARELYRSKWALQVGDGEGKKRDRADRLAQMLLTGVDFTA
jgi:lysozyme